MRPKRVLIIGNIYPSISGVSIAGEMLYEGLKDNKNYAVKLINTSFNRETKTIEKFSVSKIFKFVFYVFRLMLTLVFTRIDFIIIMHSFNWIAFLKDSIFIKIGLLFNSKIILYAHGIGFEKLFYNNLSVRRKKYVDNLMCRIYKVVVVADVMKCEYFKWINESKIVKIFNSIKPVLNNNDVRNKSELIINILYLSFISKAKGVFDLLESFYTLSKEFNNIKLIICGSFLDTKPEDKSDFFKYLECKNMFNVVDYRGHVSGNEKKQAFMDADIFVLPSHRESFGIVNIEAMSAGLPIISTNQGAIPEYIENGINGLLYEAKNVEGLENNLRKLITDSVLRNKIGSNNIIKFNEQFTSYQFVNQWMNIL